MAGSSRYPAGTVRVPRDAVPGQGVGMARKDGSQVGAAGEYYVAFRLSQMGYIVAMPRAGSPTVDLLVSNAAGSRTVPIQVKTAEKGIKEKGRGTAKKPHHIDFAVGPRSAKLNSEGLFFVFVDLKGKSHDSQPEVWVVPSTDLSNSCKTWVDKVAWVRWQEDLAAVEKYRNAWHRITDQLA